MNESRHAFAMRRPRKRKRSHTCACRAAGMRAVSGSGKSSPWWTMVESACCPAGRSQIHTGSAWLTPTLRSSFAVAE